VTDPEKLDAILRWQAAIDQRIARVEEGQKVSTTTISNVLQQIFHKLEGVLPRRVL
jgi:hypothetical protein